MIDVKKLIVGFLILATASVSSGLILMLINTASFTTPAVAPQPTITVGSPALGTNAFLPSAADVQTVIDSVAGNLASSSMIQSSTNPGNLTDVLATEFVNGVADANPNGPTSTDANGNPIIATPNINAVATYVANANATQNLQIPNWDTEAASVPIITTATSSATSIFQYGTAVNSILSNHFNTQVQNTISNTAGSANTNDLAYVETQVQNALKDTASLKTPLPAVAYQKSLIKVLVYEKDMLQLMNGAQTDPVKASIIFQSEDEKFQLALQDFQNQGQIITNATVSLQPAPLKKSTGLLSFVMDNTFGTPKAYAQWSVFDPATWGLIVANQGVNIAHELEAILKNTLLQILKNTLTALVQQKVLAWVQGSGAPLFITNWGTTLINAAQTSALGYIDSKMACGAFPAFLPQLTVNLQALYLPDNGICANEFEAALGGNTFQQFYNNFQNGGFVAFGASTLPSGNPYGAEFFQAQKADLAFQNTQAATALQTQTSGGLKGNQVCSDGSDPNGVSTFCQSPSGQYSTPNANGTCDTGDKVVTNPNNGLCENGSQPTVTTPAAVTAFTLNSAVDATPKQIAAANDIIGVLNSVLNSLMYSLSNAAVNAAGNFVNQSLTSISPSGITGGGTPPAPMPLACDPTSQTIPSPTSGGGPTATSTPAPTSTSPITVSASGGTTDANGNPPIYNWLASNGVTSTGDMFSDVFTGPGLYTITLTDSAGDASTTCTVIQQ